MIYAIYALIFLAIECCYYAIAKRKAIGAPVCERSSHTVFTPTGGGIVILLAAAIFGIVQATTLPGEWLLMLGGATVLGLVSFIDDIRPLSAKLRLIIQVAVVALMFCQYIQPGSIGIYILFLICGVGIVNAYNFADGICGMLALNSIVSIGSIMYAYSVFAPVAAPTYISFGAVLLCAIAVFALFNLRGKLFAGDIGSISIGVFIVWMLFNLIYTTGDASLIVLTIVAIFDTGLTTLHRLFVGENIMQAHRKHIYHLLTNEWHNPHVSVSAAYALMQLGINAIYFALPDFAHAGYTAATIAVLTAIYLVIRKSKKSGKFHC